MAKIRHIAIQVPDLEKAAQFYESVLDLERLAEHKSEIGDAIVLSDGTINLTLLTFPEGTRGRLNGPEWAGLHHFGVLVENADETAKKIEAAGGGFFMQIPEMPGIMAESKYKDPMGVVFDVSEHDWAQAKKA
jgi:catechol 2,3-dioxygenase-like lactoylglutathione lyase family enzyme